MKVIEHLEKADGPLISFEVIPPERGGNFNSLLETIDDLTKFNPPFIDVTSHAADVNYEETLQGIKKVVRRKRPGTLGICAVIQHKYGIEAVPHILCLGFTREETEDFLIELKYLGIENVLALRGDEKYHKPVISGKSVNEHASDLVEQIAKMNRSCYLEDIANPESSNFCIGVAGYPEKHFEAPNLRRDIELLKGKVDAGASYIVTQMFFDNQKYFDFVERCRAERITAPIIPGLKIINCKNDIRIPKSFHIDIPYELSEEIRKAKKEEVLSIGVEWSSRQTQELIDAGVPAVHFYVMGDSNPVKQVLGKLRR